MSAIKRIPIELVKKNKNKKPQQLPQQYENYKLISKINSEQTHQNSDF